MSLLNIFVSKAPTIAGYEFDAVLEDTFEASVELTGYSIELGARVSDHRIVNPFKWSIVGAVSNTPLNASVLDFAGGALSNFFDSGILSAVSGLSAGFLAGSDETRASATLNFLITLMTTGEPFDIDAGDIQLKNMVIARLRRTKDPENEGGLIFEADLQEYPTLQTTLSKNQPSVSVLNPADPSVSQCGALQNIGEIRGVSPVTSIINTVRGLFG
jgi:hypothetical protein